MKKLRIKMIMGEDWVHVDDAMEYVIDNNYEEMEEYVLETCGSQEHDMRCDRD